MKTLSINPKLIFSGILATILVIFFSQLDFHDTVEKQETKTSTTTKARTATPNYQLLYRGVAESHVHFHLAERGRVKPYGGHNNPRRHRDGDNHSVFTSWTTDVKTAFYYGTHDEFGPCDGIILVKLVDINNPDLVTDIRTVKDGDVYREYEYLLTGDIKGCFIFPVFMGDSWKELERKVLNTSIK